CAPVALLHEQAAIYAAVIEGGRARLLPINQPDLEEADVLPPGRFCGEDLEGRRLEIRRDDALDETIRLRQLQGGRLVENTVEGEDATERALRVAVERLLKRIGQG